MVASVAVADWWVAVVVEVAALLFEAEARPTEAALATSSWAKTGWPPKVAVLEIGASEAVAVEWAVVIAESKVKLWLAIPFVIRERLPRDSYFALV